MFNYYLTLPLPDKCQWPGLLPPGQLLDVQLAGNLATCNEVAG